MRATYNSTLFYRIDAVKSEMVHKIISEYSGRMYKRLKLSKLFPPLERFLCRAVQYRVVDGLVEPDDLRPNLPLDLIQPERYRYFGTLHCLVNVLRRGG